MLHLILPFLFLAHPGVDKLGAERYPRLEEFRGKKLELFTHPHGPDAKAVSEKIYVVTFAAAGEPGTFEVILSQAWRGKDGGALDKPLTFKLDVSEGYCGSASFKGQAVEVPDTQLELISHRTRTCQDLPVNDLIGFLHTGPDQKTVIKLYLAPDR